MADDIKEILREIRGMRAENLAIDKKIMYLCRHASSTETRLKNIEETIKNRGERIRECENKILKVDTRIALGASIITIIGLAMAPVISALI